VRVGLTVDGAVVQPARAGAEESSCTTADPTEGPGGTPLPREGDTYPERVARVLATDRRAIIALHRGAVDARVLDRGGRVLRTGANGAGRVRNVDGGDDDQIQVVIERGALCPSAPQSWKGVPLVFTTLDGVQEQPDVVVAGRFDEQTSWEVRDRPGVGLCATVRSRTRECGLDPGDGVDLPVRLAGDEAGHAIVYGYLPPNATTARLQRPGRRLGPPSEHVDGATFFALQVDAGDRPVEIDFFNRSGAAVGAVPYPST
jgi:hypothetical protein